MAHPFQAAIPPLATALEKVSDPRDAQGKRHPLQAMLLLASVALLCGRQTPLAISQWAADYGEDYLNYFKFTRPKPPAQATWYRVLALIDWQELESCVLEWACQVLRVLEENTTLQGIAVDGKTLRGSKKQGAANTHLLSAVVHGIGLTLFQVAVPDKTNEIGVIPELISKLMLQGYVFTADALLTQREIARQILAQDNDYLFVVKKNQKTLHEDIKLLFSEPPPRPKSEVWPSSETQDLGHGRIEHRELQATTALNDYLDWPGVQQVFRIERTRRDKKRGTVSTETVYGVTSLTPERASASQLLRLLRQHWHIENKSHWVRDVVFAEDQAQTRQGNLPHVMTTLRNAVLGVMRAHGLHEIARNLRRFAARPEAAMALVGLLVGE